MRSGRGKCPQCKEIIVVDLDAAEIRCPLCHALLKKSNKTVEEARAEEEARVAAALAREKALAEEAEEAQAAPVEEPAAEEAPAEDVAPEAEVPAEEAVAEEAPVEEEAPADEIGLSDEELAAMDETIPEEEVTAEPAEDEAAELDVPQAEEPVDEIGLTDEELAQMDEAIPEEESVEDADPDIPASVSDEEEAPAEEVSEEEEAPVDEAPLGEEIDIPDDGEVADIPVEEVPVEEAEPAEETTVEEAVDEEAPIEEEAVAEEIPVEEEPVEDEAVEEIPVEEATEEAIPVEEEPLAVEEAAEEAPEEVAVEEPAEEPAAEEVAAEAAPAEAAPAEEAGYVPTEEDMAFAASLSDGTQQREQGKGYFAPVVNNKPAAKKDSEQKKARKQKAVVEKGEKNMNENAIYKKPVALIITILSVLAAAFFFLYYKTLTIGFISGKLLAKVVDILPTFGGEKFPVYVNTIFAGLILIISILGLTGKRGGVAFVFVLLADLVFVAQKVLLGFVEIKFLADFLEKFGEYVDYGMYGLLLLGAIFLAVSLVKGSDDFEIHGGTAILPLVYLALALVGYAALVVLPKVISGFSVSAAIERYVIYGIWGLAFLLTFIGVHSATASRGANGWLLFATTMVIVLFYAAAVVLQKFGADKNLEFYPEIFYAISPVIAFFPLAGFAASDMRN